MLPKMGPGSFFGFGKRRRSSRECEGRGEKPRWMERRRSKKMRRLGTFYFIDTQPVAAFTEYEQEGGEGAAGRERERERGSVCACVRACVRACMSECGGVDCTLLLPPAAKLRNFFSDAKGGRTSAGGREGTKRKRKGYLEHVPWPKEISNIPKVPHR
ncbi:hypothetical protein LX36DRAFT_465067 [Colletotrichum falcatum]|nr:hypothetical protein LX36DRAFT_465067 [Colletotrichum falcatum]